MPQTQITGQQVLDGSVQRLDLCVSGLAGTNVIAKAIQGSGINLNSTGNDAGTGDVTMGLAQIAGQSILGNTSAGIAIPTPITSWANPAWLTSLPWSKITGAPTSLAGYGITDPVVLTSGSYSNPSWITSLGWSKISGAPTTLAGYGIASPLPAAQGGTGATTGAEPPLGNPSTNGYVLSSTTAGVRSWINPLAGGGGNVSNSGTPTVNQLAIWTDATHVQGVTALPAANFPALTGAITTVAGNLATTYNTAVPEAKGGVPTGGAAGTTMMKASATDYDSDWCAKLTKAVASTNPTGTTSTTGVMMGLGRQATPTTFALTAPTSGNVLITASGTLANNVANGAGWVGLYYGTGLAPANGAAVTGGGIVQAVNFRAQAANDSTPFCFAGVLSGLVAGTTYWIDLYAAATGTAGTTTVGGITVSITEL